jgi:hypothetical protein
MDAHAQQGKRSLSVKPSLATGSHERLLDARYL